MKYFFITIFSLIGLTISAQSNEGFVQNNVTAMNAAGSNNVRALGQSSLFFNPPREVDGRIHLFETWNNSAIIHTNDNQRFLLRNINLNLQRHTFESKVSQDSIFTFNFNNIDKFVINNKVYRNYYWDDDNKVYEVIYDGEKFQILKGFKLEFVEGSANPMLNRARDKYIQKEYYYLRKDGKIRYFKLSKGRILRMLKDNPGMADELVNFAKERKLSFKKEQDVKKIMEYYDSI